MSGINALSGYKLTYTDKPNYWSTLEESNGGLDARYSLGISMNAGGLFGTGGSSGASIGDVIVGSPADKAGLAPGFKIIAVNGRAYTTELLRTAIKDAVGKGPDIELIVENTGYFKTIKLNYHDGEKYPQFVRADGTPTRLDDILKPMTK